MDYLLKASENPEGMAPLLTMGVSPWNWNPHYPTSPEGATPLTNYIKNQKEHHKKMSSKEELRNILKDHNIEYDEKYFQ